MPPNGQEKKSRVVLTSADHSETNLRTRKTRINLATSQVEPSRSSRWSKLIQVGSHSEYIIDWSVIFLLIFGGCCSNVFALESILRYEADSGLLITFCQFLLTAIVTAWRQSSPSKRFPWIIPYPKVPISAWMLNALLFWIVNMLNNWAFRFDISVPIHIILRSGGSVTTMVVGFAWGKRYNRGQIFGVILLTFGVITAALADAGEKDKGSTLSTEKSSFYQGFLILIVAQILSAVMGLYTQHIYSTYGPHWEENLVWSHVFSLFFFASVTPQLRSQYKKLTMSPRLEIPSSFSTTWKVAVPVQLIYLFLNSLTQFFCIQGVNRLAAKSNALGVTIALNVRKLASLLLSIWLFDNELKFGVWFGAGLVCLGGAAYAGLGNLVARASISEKELKKK